MPVDDHPENPDTEYRLVSSETPVTDDGYKLGEPKLIECRHCDAKMVLTSDPTPGLSTVNHEPWCPNGQA